MLVVKTVCISKGKATRHRYFPPLCVTLGWALPAGYTEGRYVELGDCHLIIILELIVSNLVVFIVTCFVSNNAAKDEFSGRNG